MFFMLLLASSVGLFSFESIFSCLLISTLFLFVLDFSFWHLFIFCCLLLPRWLGSQGLYIYIQPFGVSLSTSRFEEVVLFLSRCFASCLEDFCMRLFPLSLCNRKLSSWHWLPCCCCCWLGSITSIHFLIFFSSLDFMGDKEFMPCLAVLILNHCLLVSGLCILSSAISYNRQEKIWNVSSPSCSGIDLDCKTSAIYLFTYLW